MSALVRRAVRELQAYQPGEQPREPGFVKLNTNENPYPPSPRIGELLARFPADSLRLYPDPVCLPLREELARLHGCGTDQVFVGNGSDEVLSMCLQALVERDGSVGYFEPSYSLYPVLARIEELETRPVELPADFCWTMPADYHASLFFLANPNAPTSMLFPHDQVEAFCRRLHGVVVVDEAYVDFADRDCLDLALSLPNVLVARTLSKSYSLAGLRVGYLVGNRELVEAFYKVKDSYNVDRLAQAIALAALQDRDHMRRNAERIRATRARVMAALVRRGFQVSPSASNFLWVRPPRDDAAGLFEALRARRILVRYFPGRLTGAHLRVSIGTDEDMDRLLAALDDPAAG